MGVRTDRLWLVNVKGAALESREKVLMNRKRLESGNYTLLVLKEGLNAAFKLMIGNTKIIYINISGNQLALNYLIEFMREIFTKQKDENIYFNPEKYYSEISFPNLGAGKVILHNATITASNIILIPSNSLRPYIFFDQLGADNIRYMVITSSPERSLKLFSDFAEVESGLGFYAVVEVNKLHVEGARFLVRFINGSSLELEGNMTLDGRFLVFARRPVFTAERATVEGVVGQSLLYPYMARDLQVHGNATLRFLVGDPSLLYFKVDALRAKVVFEPPLDVYSEWEAVPLLLKHLPLSFAFTVLVLSCGKFWRSPVLRVRNLQPCSAVRVRD
jgi:hypothetical protein